MGDAYADIPKHGGDFAKAVAVCINSRICETKDRRLMCPSFQISGNPNLSTGGRVRLLKAALSSDLADRALADPVLAQAMDLCVACKGCKRECEANVDMALIKAEYLAQRTAGQGLGIRPRLFAHLPRWLHRYRWLGHLVRWRNRSRTLAILGERILGLAASRPLPEPAPASFKTPKPEVAAPGNERPEVVLLVDTFTREFDPEVAEAAIDLLTAAGYPVRIAETAPESEEPGRPLCCGRTYLAQGLIDQARAEACRMATALRPHIDAGRLVVGLEASCVLGLRDDTQALGLDADLAAACKSVLMLEEFMAREIMAKRLALPLRSAAGQRLLVHGHCHQKAAGAMKAMRRVLKLVPELQFDMIESSCCGMAGTFGIEKEHAQIAAAMAEQTLLPALRADTGAQVLANGFSCRQQIRGFGDRRPRHLALILRQYLAEVNPS